MSKKAENIVIDGCKIIEVELEDFGHKVWQKGLWIPYDRLQREVALTKELKNSFWLLFNRNARTYLKAKIAVLETLLETYNSEAK